MWDFARPLRELIMMKNSIFDFEHSGETLILIPNTDLRELEFDALEAGSAEVFEALNSETITNVVIDFHKTDYYGSTALAFFVKFWKRIKSRGGKMVFCKVSPHEREILELTNLISLWTVCPMRQEAIDLIQSG
jgi:anti-anti-sigma factor